MSKTTINDLARAYREMKRERDRAREQRDVFHRALVEERRDRLRVVSRLDARRRELKRERDEARRWAWGYQRAALNMSDGYEAALKVERQSHQRTIHERVRDHKEVVAQRDAARAEVDSIRAALNAYGPPDSDKSGMNLAALARMYREFTEARLEEESSE